MPPHAQKRKASILHRLRHLFGRAHAAPPRLPYPPGTPEFKVRALSLMEFRVLPSKVVSGFDVQSLVATDPDIATGDRRRLRKS